MALTSGSQVAGYRIEGVLGRGGMGEVYEATQLSLHRTVALKVLRAELGADVAFRERFRREGRIQAGLDHPNIVTVHEAGELPDGDGLFLAMRLVRGPTLKERIRAGDLDPQATLALLEPIGSALDAAHAAGLTHRDVKPQNILIGPGEHPYLADFGLTRSGEDTALTRSGAFMGTIDYVAPEIIRGEPATAASDVYALACVAYECLTGVIPFARETEAAALFAHVHDPPPATATAYGLPPAVDLVMAQGMAKDAEDRPSSASELLRRLAAALGGRDVGPVGARAGRGQETIADDPTPEAPTPAAATRSATAVSRTPATRRPGRPRAAVAATVIALIAGLGATAFAIGHARRAPTQKALTTLADGTDLSLRAPAVWSSVQPERAQDIPGLELRGGVTFTADTPAAGVVAGVTDAAGRTLLPAALRRALAFPLPRAERVRLGELQALRYDGVRVRGLDRPLTLFAVAATTGVATIACYAPADAPPEVGRTCERVASTLELQRGKALPVSADAGTARRIGRVLATLDRDRAPAARRLRDGRTRQTQAGAASTIAAAYANAAIGLTALQVSPAIAPTIAAMTDDARSAARAFRALSAHAAGGDAASYAADAARARRAQDALRRDTAALGDAGYHVG